MRDFYFMRKPEVLEKEEYENPDKRVVFHYRPGERKSRMDRSTIREERSERVRHKRIVRRRIIYVLDVLIILGILGYFFWSQKARLDDGFIDSSGIRYYFRLVSHSTSEKELIVYLNNTTKSPIRLTRYSIKFYKFAGDSKELLDERVLSIKKEIGSYKTILLYASRFKFNKDIKFITIVINDGITLTHKF